MTAVDDRCQAQDEYKDGNIKRSENVVLGNGILLRPLHGTLPQPYSSHERFYLSYQEGGRPGSSDRVSDE